MLSQLELRELSNTASSAADVGGRGCLGWLLVGGVTVGLGVVGVGAGRGRRLVNLVRARRLSRASCSSLFVGVCVSGSVVVCVVGVVAVGVLGVFGGDAGWGRRLVSLVRARRLSVTICLSLFVRVGDGESVVVVVFELFVVGG